MERRAGLRRYLVTIMKKLPLPLGGQSTSCQSTWFGKPKNEFYLPFILVGEHLSITVLGGVKLKPKLSH